MNYGNPMNLQMIIQITVIKNDFFPTGIDLDFIDMNKDQFDYYESFFTFSSMMNKIIELEKIQENQSKTENDYLIIYMGIQKMMKQ